MSHAVVLQVQLPADDPEADERMLKEMVIPQAKAQPGFEKGIWMRSADGTGMGIAVFANEEAATAAADVLKPPPGGPPLLSSTLYEVGAEA